MTAIHNNILWLDLIGVFVFGLTGGVSAVRHGLDLFGVIVLAVATALAGGIFRDLLLGDVPPASLRDSRFLLDAIAAGLVTFFAHRLIEQVRRPIILLDALGLGLFAVAGCRKALAFGLDPLVAILIAVLTAIGGGLLRDVLIREVPRVLKEEIYATAALLAAVIVVIGDHFALPDLATELVAIAAAFLLRVVAVRRGWSAPKAPWSGGGPKV